MTSTRLIVKGIPKYINNEGLRKKFESFGEITDCKIRTDNRGKSRGFAFIGFKDPKNAEDAKNYMNQTYIDTSKITVEFAKPIGDLSLEECYARRSHKQTDEGDNTQKEEIKQPSYANDPEYLEFIATKRANMSWNEGVTEVLQRAKKLEEEKEKEKNTEEEDNENNEKEQPITNRIHVINLPYDTNEDEVEEFFSKYGQVTDVVIPIDRQVNRGRGYGFVTFASTDSVISALQDSIIFQGRHLKLEPAEPAKDDKADHLPDDDETFQERKKRLLKVEKPQSWNALFLNKDTVAEAASHMLGFTKAELLNPESDDIASRLTLAEAQLVKETKQLFEASGIDLSLFDNSGAPTRRSKTLIIVKNLKYQTTEEEIRNLFASYGSLTRFIFPPTHATALVEYARPEDAKKAFQALSFRKIHDQPMYLQWAPAPGNEPVVDDGNKEYKHKKKETLKQLKTTTLIMKNVPFKATKRELYDIVNTYARVKAIRMPKKADGSGHRGFVFLDFNTRQEATAALENLGDVHLYDRHLVVQPADTGRNVESIQQNNK
ncbi:RNA recognition motif domain containing protein [Histomonas meleagridis]|uniref:RNA recognition motif domain containing protein n=1 Tax=Histomonas meleagridis TaxID=135588 RepID=UPI00355A0E5C|nr:RNA recognition motif domain containing protein [Histomonas meleagridis]KAH0800632.1 RNA recognition motif domain containing protein [Histomonas meleagridis]